MAISLPIPPQGTSTGSREFGIFVPQNTGHKDPFASVRKVSDHLTRRALKARIREEGSIPEILWTQRARAVEEYAQDVIATQTDTVDRVEINEIWHQEGPDLKIYFVEGVAIDSLGGEIKSSSLELHNGKQKIRDEMFEEEIRSTLIGPWTEDAMAAAMKEKSELWNQKTDEEKERIISQRLTEKGIILINGGEKDFKEKTPEEILRDSFYPQLNRAAQKALREQTPEPSGQLVAFPRLKPVQVFPQAA